jgi:tripartite ATP-independent transporter DctM subunit
MMISGMIIIVLLFILIFLGVPIAIVLGIVATVGILLLPQQPMLVLAQSFFGAMNYFPFVAVPFFVLAGEIMNKAQITKRLVDFAGLIVGRAPAGLANVNILACMFFGGVTGAGTAETAAIGGLLIPAMEEEGYPKDFAVALTACASVMGPIIPPSIIMVLYSALVGTSVGGMFVGGIVPGIMIAISLMAVVIIADRKRHFPRRTIKLSREAVLSTTLKAVWPLGMPVIIVGGILSGVFSATESGAMAVVYSLIVGFFVLRTLKFDDLLPMIRHAALVTASIMLVVGSAKALSWIFSVMRIQYSLEQFFLSLSPLVFLAVVNALLLFMGTFMDGSANLIIMAPVLAPIAIKLGIDPIHFGLIMTINLTIGLVTPPLGLCLFVGCRIGNLPLEKVVKPALPFIMAEVAVLLLLTYIPAIPMTLPRMLGY